MARRVRETIGEAQQVDDHWGRRMTRRALLLATASAALAACGGSVATGESGPTRAAPGTVPSGAATAPTAPDPSPASLVPAAGTSFGVNLDWAHDTAAAFNTRLGMKAAAYVQFVSFPLGDGERTILDQFFAQVAAQRGLAVVTLQPTIPLAQITPAMADDLAAYLARYNDRGTGALVRFAHEMNGDWYPWSQQPEAYVAAFRGVAAAVHRTARGSGMLWAPNYGGGYPFSGGAYGVKPGTPDFARLDTNHDGKLDGADDPYTPYYPGDDAVDWVGLSLYHWGNVYPWGKNVIPEDHKFSDQISGSYNGLNGDDRGVPDFYTTFAAGHARPMAIVETAALYNPSVGGDDELAIKQAWWRQVFAPEIATRFPSIKLINWFEWRKPESEIGGTTIDWTVTLTPRIREAFRADFPRDRFNLGGT
ncbi:MAG TPA: hypothetical protein VMU89_24175 [Thermomicrobiaceae bacterium]|nr:hypothetical protein [Thermomicrobiaceae bacterium]